MTELAGGGTTVLLTTQYLEEADQLADRIAVIDDGRVIAEGTADELKDGRRRRDLDDVFLTLTERTCDVLGDQRLLTLIGRSVRHSMRSIDALLTAAMLPMMILLLFVYVFGGAIQTGGDYVDYVVPGIILLCAGLRLGHHRGRRLPGHDERRDRPLPVAPDRRSAVLTGPRRGERAAQRRLDRARGRRGAARSASAPRRGRARAGSGRSRSCSPS